MKTTTSHPAEDANDTPMWRQYKRFKQKFPRHLLLFRLGDFYELFFEDAQLAAKTLDIALTRRGSHRGQPVAMAGVPVRAAEAYIARLVKAGHRVAVCEQGKAAVAGRKLMERYVHRVLTPGTLSEETMLEARQANYLAALAQEDASDQSGWGLAWIELTAGDFRTRYLADDSELEEALAVIAPAELVVSETSLDRLRALDGMAPFADVLVGIAAAGFDAENALRSLCERFLVATLDGLGSFSTPEIAAAGAVIAYAEAMSMRQPEQDDDAVTTQRTILQPPSRLLSSEMLSIDSGTRRNLELTRTISGERAGSLLASVDLTCSAGGARLLAERLSAPLCDITILQHRLDVVDWFHANDDLREKTRRILRAMPDLPRAVGRLMLGNGQPRDLGAVRDGLACAALLRQLLLAAEDQPGAALPLLNKLAGGDELTDLLRRALVAELAMPRRDGGYIANRYAPELDQACHARDENRRSIAGLEVRLRAETQITQLRVRHNNLIGYFLEVPRSVADRLKAPFTLRQTVAQTARFALPELEELAGALQSENERTLAIEDDIFTQLVERITIHADAIRAASSAAAALDVAAGNAELSSRRGWIRPDLIEDRLFEVEGGRHPIVESVMKTEFVANDCHLSDQTGRIWLVTGPNMAGKSTFLRQNALIAILAQIGSRVPAKRARIGVLDRLFCRVGASDDLVRGRSTFMVEMVETAAILTQATSRSLVILDEVGRGTATHDGLAIAWATIEHLHAVNRSCTLFATHFLELAQLGETLPDLRPVCMQIRSWKGDIVFLHQLAPGAADQAFGLHVAKLAGIPESVLARARALQGEFAQHSAQMRSGLGALPLFTTTQHTVPRDDAEQADIPAIPPGSTVCSAATRDLLDELEPDRMTPREAMQFLYRLYEAEQSS